MLSRHYRKQFLNYDTVRWKSKMTLPMAIFDIAILWYYSFSGSITLRPFASIFWIAMAIIGIFVFDMNLFPLNRYTQVTLLSLGYMLIMSLFSIDRDASIKYVLSMFLYLIIAVEITSNYQNILFFLKTLLVYSVILLVVSYIQKFVPDLYLRVFEPFLPQDYHHDIITFMKNGAVTGFFNQTSANALAMCLGVSVCIYQFLKSDSQKPVIRIWSIILCGAFFYGVILTNRRGSLLIMIILLAYLIYTYRNNWITKILFTISGVWLLIFGGIDYIPALSDIISKNTQHVVAGDISNGRFDIWAECFFLFSQKPFFGFGADSLVLLINASSAHNSYIQALVEQGLVGILVFFAPFVYGLILGFTKRKNLRIPNKEQNALISFAMFWQLYCFLNALFEATFATERTIFMLFVTQLIAIKASRDWACGTN